MGELIIEHKTFEFVGSNDDNFKSLFDFFTAGNLARKNGDGLHATELLFSFKFGWGFFNEDLAYTSYDQIKKNDKLSWMNQTLHQMCSNFFYQNPSGRTYFKDITLFRDKYKNEHHGVIGCLSQYPVEVFCNQSWNEWKVTYFKNNPEKFDWNLSEDEFLPNKSYSNQILIEELKKHKKLELVEEGNIALAFHEHVMKLKGPEIKSYSIEIGTKVAEANFFTFEKEISSDEERITNAPRKIFSFKNKNMKYIYISIDHAHGMFEFHNSKGEHLGEFKFDGTYNSNPDSTHNLKSAKIK